MVRGRRLETQRQAGDGITNGFWRPIITTGGMTMTRENITHRLKQLALVGAFAALVALGAASAGVAGDPSQWVAVAGDPSQWGLAGPATVNDAMISLNFTKIV